MDLRHFAFYAYAGRSGILRWDRKNEVISFVISFILYLVWEFVGHFFGKMMSYALSYLRVGSSGKGMGGFNEPCLVFSFFKWGGGMV